MKNQKQASYGLTLLYNTRYDIFKVEYDMMIYYGSDIFVVMIGILYGDVSIWYFPLERLAKKDRNIVVEYF